MAGNSLESLLAWMKDRSQMRGWDLIVALEGRQTNLGLQQNHIIRLSQGTDLGNISGSFDIPETNITHYLSGFSLAAPALSFEHASLQSAKTALSVAVVGGTQMTVETVQGQKNITRLSALDPLDGSHLTLDLPIGADSRSVHLDLANSEDVLLTLFNTPNEQREAGKLFKDWFETLDNDSRVYTLGTFPGEGNPLMLTRSIDVRTQARDGQELSPQALNENGAVLLFASMVDGSLGDLPGDGSGFRYLIPDDDAQNTYSATALFSSGLIHRAAFGHAVLQLLDNAEFERILDEEGSLTRMVAKRGVLQATAGTYQSLDYQFESEAFSLPATEGALPLTVEFAPREVIQRWHSTFTLPFRYRPVGGTNWNTYTATFNINLQHKFHLSADESGVSAMEGELFVPYGNSQEVSHVSGLPGTIGSAELEQIKDFVAFTVKRALLESFSNTLTTTASDTFVKGVDIVGGSTLHPSHVALPLDLAMFGQLQSAGSSFSIVQPQRPIAAGKLLQLTTDPVRTDLRWAVENLSGGGNPGTIEEQIGLYRAPPAHSMTDTYSQVLAVATDRLTGEKSAALIRVQANPITINPLIQTCYYGQQVELSAGQLDGSELSWSIKNPVPGESGELVASDKPGGDHTYIAGPQVPRKTYVLDEVEVKDSQGQTRSTYVLVLQREPGATIKPVENSNLPDGQIQLQAFVNGNPIEGQWSLRLDGPGSIDPFTGIYSDNPGAKERFVLITVLVDGGEFGEFEGHIVLPLPLTDFPTVLSALAK